MNSDYFTPPPHPFVCFGLLIIFHVQSCPRRILQECVDVPSSLYLAAGLPPASTASCFCPPGSSASTPGLHFSFLCRGICCWGAGGHVFFLLGFLSYFSHAYPRFISFLRKDVEETFFEPEKIFILFSYW